MADLEAPEDHSLVSLLRVWQSVCSHSSTAAPALPQSVVSKLTMFGRCITARSAVCSTCKQSAAVPQDATAGQFHVPGLSRTRLKWHLIRTRQGNHKPTNHHTRHPSTTTSPCARCDSASLTTGLQASYIALRLTAQAHCRYRSNSSCISGPRPLS